MRGATISRCDASRFPAADFGTGRRRGPGHRGFTRTTGTSRTVMAVSTRSCVDRSDAHTGTRRNLLRNIDRLETPSGPHEFGQLERGSDRPDACSLSAVRMVFPSSQASAVDVARSCPSPVDDLMKKHNQNTSSHAAARLPIHRETVRIITGQDLALVAGGSSTVVTERPTTAAPAAITTAEHRPIEHERGVGTRRSFESPCGRGSLAAATRGRVRGACARRRERDRPRA